MYEYEYNIYYDYNNIRVYDDIILLFSKIIIIKGCRHPLAMM